MFKIQQFSFKEMHLKMSSAKVAAMLPGLNVLTHWGLATLYVIIDHGYWSSLPDQHWEMIETNIV